MPQSDIAILIPGQINRRVTERLEARYKVIAVERGASLQLDAATAATVRGAAVSGSFPAAWIEALPNLEIIGNFGVGYDGIDVRAAADRKIVVTNTPDVLNDEVADTTIGLLLNTLRRLPQAENYLRAGRWVAEGAFPLSPLSLRGRHVGLFGLGRIGLEIAHRLEAFKVKVSYHTRTPRTDVGYDHFPTLAALAEAVDTLICIVPKTAETHKAVDAGIFRALGANGVFINVGRGWSVDEEALVAALADKTIAAAGLDVFYDEPNVPEGLLGFDNVSLLPHVASASVPTRQAMADLVADNILDWFDKGVARTPVPETPFRRG
ncbi:2-hydroxyacid dehydrogenase [Rhizobium sp. LjRoot30]|uniref:2-hydroxyacid dehydrogenase n=1 Tax=Rhizobium sp. LjRoot30 TaxID=3342320 RepID=UPI003ECF323B